MAEEGDVWRRWRFREKGYVSCLTNQLCIWYRNANLFSRNDSFFIAGRQFRRTCPKPNTEQGCGARNRINWFEPPAECETGAFRPHRGRGHKFSSNCALLGSINCHFLHPLLLLVLGSKFVKPRSTCFDHTCCVPGRQSKSKTNNRNFQTHQQSRNVEKCVVLRKTSCLI